MTLRRLVGTLVGTVVLLGLAGCTPDPHPYLALSMAGGRPTILVAECARSAISYVTVRESSPAASPAAQWQVASPVGTPGPGGVRERLADAPARITLFETPPGWLVQRETLREVREDAEYSVSGGTANAGSLTFTVAQLRDLAPGTVLTAVGYRDQHVVSEGAFEKAAQKDCDNS